MQCLRDIQDDPGKQPVIGQDEIRRYLCSACATAHARTGDPRPAGPTQATGDGPRVIGLPQPKLDWSGQKLVLDKSKNGCIMSV